MKKALQNNLYMLKYMWKYCKSNVILRLLSTLTAPVQPFIFIITMQLAIDGIAENRDLRYLLTIIFIAFSVGALSSIFNAWINSSSNTKAQQKISKGIQDELLKKALTLDLACYDDSEYYDKYVRAMQEADSRAIAVLDSVVEVLSSIFALLMITSLIIALSPTVIVLCVVILLLNILLNTKRNKVVFKRDMEITRSQREAAYSKKMFYEPQYAQELRLGKLGSLMNKKFLIAMDKTLSIIKKYCGKFVFLDSAFSIVGFSLMSSVMAFASWQITIGNLTIGAFAALLNGSQQLLERLFALFNQIPNLFKNSLYIENFRKIIDYVPRISSDNNSFVLNEINGNIIIKNLSFSYPGKDITILKNIDMEIQSGKKTAIVGYNGAGKSTLVKLLLRFYDPNSGDITIDNINYKDIEINSLRNKFGVLFQNYKCYAFTVAENVLLDDYIDKNIEDKLISSLKYSGIYEKISSFEKGIQTNLSREFDSEGVPLSGGEEQKIAISRAFVEDKDILILDEPSSSLDPLAEYDINKKIIELATNKTVIFVSHRLSTVRMADMIYMIDNGEVIEHGSHNELMKLNGKYCDMFTKQAENYQA